MKANLQKIQDIVRQSILEVVKIKSVPFLHFDAQFTAEGARNSIQHITSKSGVFNSTLKKIEVDGKLQNSTTEVTLFTLAKLGEVNDTAVGIMQSINNSLIGEIEAKVGNAEISLSTIEVIKQKETNEQNTDDKIMIVINFEINIEN